MPKYTVHLMTAYCTYKGVEANGEDEAMKKVHFPPEFDINDPHTLVAYEEEEDDEERGVKG